MRFQLHRHTRTAVYPSIPVTLASCPAYPAYAPDVPVRLLARKCLFQPGRSTAGQCGAHWPKSPGMTGSPDLPHRLHQSCLTMSSSVRLTSVFELPEKSGRYLSAGGAGRWTLAPGSSRAPTSLGAPPVEPVDQLIGCCLNYYIHSFGRLCDAGQSCPILRLTGNELHIPLPCNDLHRH